MHRLSMWFKIGVAAIMVLMTLPVCGDVYYVQVSGDDSLSGTSWSQAKETVGAALRLAASGDEIWIASGTYKENIVLKSGVSVFGGFKGDETLREQRQPSVNVTIADGIITADLARCDGIRCSSQSAVNSSGNITASETKDSGDTPTIAVAISGDIGTNYTPISVSGWASADTVRVHWSSDQGGKGECDGTEYWYAYEIELAYGVNVLTFEAINEAGNTATCQVTVKYYDAPVLTIKEPTEGDIYVCDTAEIELSGTVEYDSDQIVVSWSNYGSYSEYGEAEGTHSWKATIPLTSGINDVNVYADTDTGQCSDQIRVIYSYYDAQPPRIETQTGPIYSNAQTFQLTGTAKDDCLIKSMTWSNNRGGTGEISYWGESWQAYEVPLEVGDNIVTITASDYSGHSTSVDVTVVCDMTTPTISITSPTDQPIYSSTDTVLKIVGIASDNSDTVRISCMSQHDFSPIVVGTTSWEASVGLWPGENAIIVIAEDAAGNSASATLVVDCTLSAEPRITILDPTDASSYEADYQSISLGGTLFGAPDGATIEIETDRRATGTAYMISEDEWTYYGSLLEEGTNVIIASVKDGDNIVATDTITVEYHDKTPPEVWVRDPSNYYNEDIYYTSQASVSITAEARDDANGVKSVTWSTQRGAKGICWNTGADSWASEEIPLDPGLNTITIEATDNLGNSGFTTWRAYRDTVAPTVRVREGQPTTTDESRISIIIDASDNVRVSDVWWYSDGSGGNYCYQQNGYWVADVVLTAPENNITITAEDEVDNQASTTYSISFSDANPPSVTITTPDPSKENYTNGAGVEMHGTATDDNSISEMNWLTDRLTSGDYIYVYGYGDCFWDANWVPLELGTNIITVTASDACGNTASAETSVTRVETSPAGVWHGLVMVSVPVVPVQSDPSYTVNFSQNMWATYDPNINWYLMYPDSGTFLSADSIGRGYWAFFDEQASQSTWQDMVGEMVDQGVKQTIPLRKGWNMIGSPFALPVKWNLDEIEVVWKDGSTKTLRESSEVVHSYLWGWEPDEANPRTGVYYPVADPSVISGAHDQIEPWLGYWIRAMEDCGLVLPSPQTE